MNLLFIVGSPRSGTTLLQRLITEKFGYRTLPETHFFSLLLPSLKVKDWNSDENITNEQYEKLKQINDNRIKIKFPKYSERFTKKSLFETIIKTNVKNLSSEELVVEKTPNHGRFISEIKKLYPQAKFIHIIRHPLDSISSIYSMKPTSPGDSRIPEKKDLKEICDLWKDNVFMALGASWKEDVLNIKYEDFIANPLQKLNYITSVLKTEKHIKSLNIEDKIYDPEWEPWKKNGQQGIIDSSDKWKDRISYGEANFIENYLEAEIKYLGYKRKTKRAEDSSVRAKLKKKIRSIIGDN